MKILQVKTLAIPEIKVIRFARFCDGRGYFTESYRISDVLNHPDLDFMKNIKFVQSNESFSKPGTIRGLHFQWNPLMGKLVRTVFGHMVDMVLDIRRDSPSFGKIIAYDMPANGTGDFGEWIWVPPGFAHGNFFREPTWIEYFCSGQYNPECEAGISALSKDIDWSISEPGLKRDFDEIVSGKFLISNKDRNAFTLAEWKMDSRHEKFTY